MILLSATHFSKLILAILSWLWTTCLLKTTYLPLPFASWNHVWKWDAFFTLRESNTALEWINGYWREKFIARNVLVRQHYIKPRHKSTHCRYEQYKKILYPFSNISSEPFNHQYPITQYFIFWWILWTSLMLYLPFLIQTQYKI